MMSKEADRAAMTEMLMRKEPFCFVKFGDGELECISGSTWRNCDGQQYSPELKSALIEAYGFIYDLPNAIMTLWCPDRLRQKASESLNLNGRYFADIDTLLLHDETERLAGFYAALIRDGRKKVFVGPRQMHRATALLGCARHIEVPRPNAFSAYQRVLDEILAEAAEVYLFCAGLASKVWIADLLKANPAATCIDLGSALDPLYFGRTRASQISTEQAKEFFSRVKNAA
jgi:hypothetical protein